ncbi:DUF4377 domain-containing protein [Myroides marinus]|uniref:DUF4377 domain-containing protein n=1 Tax=Myroides marinus TaxID=703342 RepID=UPI002575822B|nr:DUF4377 domain-containing protein [Myroides marinus]MDM1352120.1 DUF4377 domain-containing protein [Myroides marinus]MDM1359338.1 DUF4377 domain-containing protein [Myroides marinus]
MKLKKIIQYLTVFTMLIGLLVACSSDDNSPVKKEDMRVQVEPYTVMRGIPPFKTPEVEHMVLIKNSDGSTDYTVGIKGFIYEKGYTYILDVTKVIDYSLQDGNLWYELVKVISKEKK